MSAPNLGISVEPLQNGKATYLPLVARTSQEKAQGQIVLRLVIKNNGAAPVTISAIEYAFPGSSVAPVAMQGVSQYFATYYSTSSNATLKPGESKTWTNGLVTLVPGDTSSQVNNAIFLNEPIPGTIEVRVHASGFPEAATVKLPLTPHKAPTPSGAYLFPYGATDLRVGEYFVGSAVHWANGGANGTQIFAHDFGCEGVDADGNWSRILPGKNGKHNADYRIYGKPIRAMADGTVAAFWDSSEENTTLGQFPTPTPNPGTGNSLTIVHGDEKIVYCHMQKGSMPASLKTIGAHVKAGQVIGLVGNTGNSTEPHTHVECEGTDSTVPLRPLPFRDAFAIAQTAFHPPNPAGPWSKVAGRGLPKDTVAFWPSESPPAWYPPGWGEVAQFGVAEASYQGVFEHAQSSGYRPVWVDGYEVQGKTFLNVIFRPSGGHAWIARHGMTGMEYQEEFNSATKQGFRLSNLASYVSGGSTRYAAIFDKVDGPAWRAYHGIDAKEHQHRFDAWTAEGYRPVNVSVTASGGNRAFAGLYEKHDVGSFVHLAGITAEGYQKAWDDNAAAGRRLAYLNAYNDGSGPRFSAIFQEKTPGSGPVHGRHGLTATELQAQYDANLAAGNLTRVLVGYESNGSARFAAMWRKA